MWDSHTDSCNSCQYSRTRLIMHHDGIDDACLDKENMQSLSPMKTSDLSMYDSSIQSHAGCAHRPRRPLEQHDSNSQDSGYHGERCLSHASPSKSSESFGLNCLGSMEDEYLDFTDIEPLGNKTNTKLPQGFNKLITNPLIERPVQENKSSPTFSVIRPLFRRALSLQSPCTDITPNSSRVRTSLFKDDEVQAQKRREPPCNSIDTGIKRSRIFDDDEEEEASVPTSRPILQRPFSTEETIMCAVQRSSNEPDLIGDFSKNFSLPLTNGKHQDLKAITPQTLARLMQGEFKDIIGTFKVIDCRYPYEFEGGHIRDAINIYTKEQCAELLNDSHFNNSQERHILVFHCEFSSERGPNLYRYLRKQDRQRNETSYPSLNYPEIYLLEGGYKNFFQQFATMCVPESYKEMLHPDHEEDLKHFRQKSRTWNSDTRSRPQQRVFKRLGI